MFVIQKARQKAFSRKPFGQIHEIGFCKIFIGETSRWAFTEEILEGNVNGFIVRANLSEEKPNHTLEFTIPLAWKKIDEQEFKQISQKFQLQQAEFGIGRINKYYNSKSHSLQYVTDLKNDLDSFTTMLRDEGFQPG